MSSIVHVLPSGMSLNDGMPPCRQNILLSTTAASGIASNAMFTSSQISSPSSSPNLLLHSLKDTTIIKSDFVWNKKLISLTRRSGTCVELSEVRGCRARERTYWDTEVSARTSNSRPRCPRDLGRHNRPKRGTTRAWAVDSCAREFSRTPPNRDNYREYHLEIKFTFINWVLFKIQTQINYPIYSKVQVSWANDSLWRTCLERFGISKSNIDPSLACPLCPNWTLPW